MNDTRIVDKSRGIHGGKSYTRLPSLPVNPNTKISKRLAARQEKWNETTGKLPQSGLYGRQRPGCGKTKERGGR